jgi:hypothetical protein
MDPRASARAALGGPVRALLAMMLAEPDPLLARIAADVNEHPDRIRAALERHVELVSVLSADATLAEVMQEGDGSRLPAGTAAVLDQLRADGVAAAETGERLERLLDRHLSAGWVIWEAAANAENPASAVMGALGSALLRAGDLAAAAIADGFGTAERDRVARRTALVRGYVDEVLTPGAGDVSLARAAGAIGLDPVRPLRVIVAWLGALVDDDDRRVAQVARAIGRPPRPSQAADTLPLVATRHGRLVIIDAGDRDLDPRLHDALAAAAPAGWWAVAGAPVMRPADLAASASDATGALDVAIRQASPARVLGVAELSLERALLADEGLLRAAVDAELAPLLAAPRSGPELVETLDAYLAEGMSVTGTARRLHLAPRTVTYRLERIEALRGGPLDAAAWRRYAVLLAARDLLASTARGDD